MEAASFVALGDQFAYSGLDDRTSTRLQSVDLAPAKIHAQHIVAFMSQASRGHCSYIAQTEDANRLAHADPFYLLVMLMLNRFLSR
jgi:hypothetical protein